MIDFIAVTRRNERTDELVYKKSGAITTTGTSEISADGETITLTLSTNGVVTTGVYRRMK